MSRIVPLILPLFGDFRVQQEGDPEVQQCVTLQVSAFGWHAETRQILHYHSPWLQSFFKDNEAWVRWSKYTCQSQIWGALGNR